MNGEISPIYYYLFSHVFGSNARDAVDLIDGLGKIQNLSLIKYENPTPDDLFKYCTSLKVLELDGAEMTWLLWVEGLKSITLTNCNNIKNAAFHHLPNLTRVGVDLCARLSSDFCKWTPKLEHLSLGRGFRGGSKEVAALTNLVSLSMPYDNGDDCYKSVKDLRLYDISSDYLPFVNFPNVVDFCAVTRMQRINVCSSKVLPEFRKKLISLDVAGSMFTNDYVAEFIYIETLDVSRCPLITHEITKRLTRLVEVIISADMWINFRTLIPSTISVVIE
jgi:hypothetical protein